MTLTTTVAEETDAALLYLDLMKQCLTRFIFPEHYRPLELPRHDRRRVPLALAQRLLARRGLALVRRSTFIQTRRAEGMDWPAEAETMIGLKRLNNIQHCVTDVLRNGVPGDLIETGVWRGGATIFMRAILRAYGDTRRTVWVTDSFQGLPRPDAERYPADAGDKHWTKPELSVSINQVKANFARYGLLDDQVRFLAGWFRDTLPTAPIEQLAVVRLDGDMYESTMEALQALYPKLSVGGYLIVDDYSLRRCRRAVEDYRAEHEILEPIVAIDRHGAYWQRLR